MPSSSPTPSEGRIQVERRGAILLIGIDRPAKRNGFTEAMLTQLGQAYQQLEDEPAPRVAVLHAFGDHFSAGLQLDQLEARLRAGRHLAPEGRQVN